MPSGTWSIGLDLMLILSEQPLVHVIAVGMFVGRRHAIYSSRLKLRQPWGEIQLKGERASCKAASIDVRPVANPARGPASRAPAPRSTEQ